MRPLPALFLSGCCTFSAPPYRGPVSDHFDGAAFSNLDPSFEQKGFGDLLYWLWTREPVEWPEHVAIERHPPPPRAVGPGALRVTFVNHATMLIQLDGVNVLTDPIWSERPSPVSFAGPRRIHDPGVAFDDLPRIDLVIISHSHYDHLDLPTLRRLFERDQPRVLVGLGSARIVRDGGVPKVRELDWWQSHRHVSGLRVTSVPVQHFANRGLCDRNGQLWTGWVLESAGGKVYVGGDTGFGPHFAEAGARFGGFRLAVLPIGAFLPRWFMAGVHIGPVEAVEAHRALGARHSVGMHFGTFQLAEERPDEPVEVLAEARRAAGIDPSVFRALRPGEGWDVPPAHDLPAPAPAARTPLPPAPLACRDALQEQP